MRAARTALAPKEEQPEEEGPDCELAEDERDDDLGREREAAQERGRAPGREARGEERGRREEEEGPYDGVAAHGPRWRGRA